MTVFFLPGLGATRAMYQSPWDSLPSAVFLDWPHGESFHSIEDVARWCIQTHGIAASDIVVGSSLGGMVAAEIASQINLRHVILLGSALSPREVSKLLQFLSPLASLTPVTLIQKLSAKVGCELGDMFAQVDSAFVRSMCRAVFEWPGVERQATAVARIHGSRDHVISCPQDAHVIADGGHLIAMTHAEECCAIVRSIVECGEDQ